MSKLFNAQNRPRGQYETMVINFTNIPSSSTSPFDFYCTTSRKMTKVTAQEFIKGSRFAINYAYGGGKHFCNYRAVKELVTEAGAIVYKLTFYLQRVELNINQTPSEGYDYAAAVFKILSDGSSPIRQMEFKFNSQTGAFISWSSVSIFEELVSPSKLRAPSDTSGVSDPLIAGYSSTSWSTASEEEIIKSQIFNPAVQSQAISAVLSRVYTKDSSTVVRNPLAWFLEGNTGSGFKLHVVTSSTKAFKFSLSERADFQEYVWDPALGASEVDYSGEYIKSEF